MDVTLAAQGLSFRGGEKAILDDVDVEVARGDVLAVLGPNGAGKTTLLRLLAGLLDPSGGAIERRGRCCLALQSGPLARRTVLRNVEDGLRWWGVDPGERRGRAEGALERMGVLGVAERRADRLSGGQARRVHLARAVAVEPDTLLLDEPFAGLDSDARSELLYDAASVLRSPDRATVVVVHDLAEALALADRMLIVVDGRAASEGAPRDVLDRPASPAVARFLGYRSSIERGASTLMLRPRDVALRPDGALTARVEARFPQVDGVRLRLAADGGEIWAEGPHPGPGVGEQVRFDLIGGVEFPRDPGTEAGR